MYEITRWFEIDAGHRVMNHSGKCKQLHGHRYKIGITLRSDKLDRIGVVEDFGDLKLAYGQYLDRNIDHGFIFQQGDPWVEVFQGQTWMDQKLWLIPYPATAEGISQYLYEVWHAVDKRITSIAVYETPNCFAIWQGHGN